MNVKRITAIVLIFLFAGGGWFILGAATDVRSSDRTQRLNGQVQALYGTTLVQRAPRFGIQIPGTDQFRWLMPAANDIKVELQSDYRKKGLIWYPTYRCSFNGAYTIANTDEAAQKVRLHFDFPAKGGTYDNFSIALDGESLMTPIDTAAGIDEILELDPGQSRILRVTYNTRGLDEWYYQMDPNVGRVQNLNLTVHTDFENFDYTEGSWAATQSGPSGNGMALSWITSDLITGQNIGIVIPERLNPGPLTTRITFFAPVCLLFFFVLVMTINILCRVDIHPMHYLFVAAGFFAFHLLLSYLVGVLNVHLSFIISAVVSVTLVTSYLKAALKGSFPWKVAIAGQLFYLILFSYSFFLKGITGLTVAIGSVITLAVLMRVTADLDWNEIFRRPPRNDGPATPPPDKPGRPIVPPPAPPSVPDESADPLTDILNRSTKQAF
jgi:hypothetical protein